MGTLAEFTARPGEVHFDLAAVEYCDLAGLRAIVRLAAANGHPAGTTRRVILHAVPQQLKKVLSILGWDSTAGLAMNEPANGGAQRGGLAVANSELGSQ